MHSKGTSDHFRLYNDYNVGRTNNAHLYEGTEEPPFPPHVAEELMRIVLTKNYFEFNSKMYHQTHGTAMGTKMAPSYANLFMAELEADMIAQLPQEPILRHPTHLARHIHRIGGGFGSRIYLLLFFGLEMQEDRTLRPRTNRPAYADTSAWKPRPGIEPRPLDTPPLPTNSVGNTLASASPCASQSPSSSPRRVARLYPLVDPEINAR